LELSTKRLSGLIPGFEFSQVEALPFHRTPQPLHGQLKQIGHALDVRLSRAKAEGHPGRET
jgi:hypothetical protein